MTQLQQVERRTTVLTSAVVAAVISVVITLSGLLLIPALTGVTTSVTDSPNAASLDRAVDAGRAWERQRQVESAEHYNGVHAAERAGLEWQLRYEQTNPLR